MNKWYSYKPVPLKTKGMLVPVCCRRCGGIYDLTTANRVARYADCDVFITPCCNKQVDTRKFVSNPAYEEL